MKRPQRTIAGPARMEGRGLFGGARAAVALLPADAGHGICFRRKELEGEPDIPASVAWTVEDPARATTLRRGNARIRMVEHVLSAAFGLGVDNLVIEVDAEEMPAGDGSALAFVELLQSAGIVEQGAEAEIASIPAPILVSRGAAVIEALPADGGLRVACRLDYGERFFGAQEAEFLVDAETYAREIAPARTFVLRPEIEAFLERGMGRGAGPGNLLVVEEDGSITGERRFDNECARHKVVDLLGDLCLAERPFSGSVRGVRSGHAANVELAAKLAAAWAREAATGRGGFRDSEGA